MDCFVGFLYKEAGTIAIGVIVGVFILVPWLRKQFAIYRKGNVDKLEEKANEEWKELDKMEDKAIEEAKKLDKIEENENEEFKEPDEMEEKENEEFEEQDEMEEKENGESEELEDIEKTENEEFEELDEMEEMENEELKKLKDKIAEEINEEWKELEEKADEILKELDKLEEKEKEGSKELLDKIQEEINEESKELLDKIKKEINEEVKELKKKKTDEEWKEREMRAIALGAQPGEFIGEGTKRELMQDCTQMLLQSQAKVKVYLQLLRAKPGAQWPERATLMRGFSKEQADMDMIERQITSANSVPIRALKYIEPSNVTSSPNVNSFFANLLVEMAQVKMEESYIKVTGDRTLVRVFCTAQNVFGFLLYLLSKVPTFMDQEIDYAELTARCSTKCKHLDMDCVLLAFYALAHSGKVAQWARLQCKINTVRKIRSDLGESCGPECYLVDEHVGPFSVKAR